MFVAAVAAGCGQDGAGRARAADLDEVLLSNGGPQLMAMDVRTCASRTLPVSGVRPDSVAFTRDHRMVATLRMIEHGHSGREASRLNVGPASQNGRDTVWTVGDHAPGGMSFDPSGKRIALGLARNFDRGGNVPDGAVEDGLWIVNASGDGRRLLVPGYPHRFAWNPAGTLIAGVTFEDSPEHSGSRRKVWIVDVGTGRQRTVTTLDQPSGADGVMDWSPDGLNILLFTGTTDGSHGWAPSKLEQIDVADGSGTTLLSSVESDFYTRAVYAADGQTVIAHHEQYLRRPSTPPGQTEVATPYGGWTLTAISGTTVEHRTDLISVRTDGTDLRSLCPIDNAGKLLDWH